MRRGEWIGEKEEEGEERGEVRKKEGRNYCDVSS